MKKISKFIVAALILSLGFSSCEEDEEILPSITGNVSYALPQYAEVGDKFDLVAVGDTDEEDVEFRWTAYNVTTDTIYGRNFSITIPDSLATYSVSLTLSKDGYYTRTISNYVVAVRLGEDGSIQGVDSPDTKFVDVRDNNEYGYVTIGELDWFSENLRWKGTDENPIGAGYAKTDIMGETLLGRLYTWNDATGGESAAGLGSGVQGVCPEGWSIPTNEDWEDFAKAINGGVALPFVDNWEKLGEKLIPNEALFNDTQIWSYSGVTILSNEYKWNALAGGNSSNNYNDYKNLFKYGFWWSSTEKSSDMVGYRYIYFDNPNFPMEYTEKNGLGASVRCVRLAKK